PVASALPRACRNSLPWPCASWAEIRVSLDMVRTQSARIAASPSAISRASAVWVVDFAMFSPVKVGEGRQSDGNSSRSPTVSARGSGHRPSAPILEGGGKRGRAGAAQRHERLVHLPAEALERGRGFVTDAVHREHHQIDATDQAAQQTAAIVDAAV